MEMKSTNAEEVACNFKDWLVDLGYMTLEDGIQDEQEIVNDFYVLEEKCPKLFNLFRDICDREWNETRFSLRRTEEIYMSKKYYPIEDAVNNVSQKFKLGLKDANEMDEEEFNNVEEYILKYVKFVSHPDYAQLIPQSLETGEYIL